MLHFWDYSSLLPPLDGDLGRGIRFDIIQDNYLFTHMGKEAYRFVVGRLGFILRVIRKPCEDRFSMFHRQKVSQMRYTSSNQCFGSIVCISSRTRALFSFLQRRIAFIFWEIQTYSYSLLLQLVSRPSSLIGLIIIPHNNPRTSLVPLL